MPKIAQPVLRCALCSKRFGEEDVKSLSFFPSTSACFNCYRGLSKKPYSHTCFGKPNVEKSGKIIRFGYDPNASEDCRIHCPHKDICRLFYKKKIYRLRRFLLTPFFGDASDVFRSGLKGIVKRMPIRKLTKHDQSLLTKERKGNVTWVVDHVKKVFKIYYLKKVNNAN